jgi:hypothetical protein
LDFADNILVYLLAQSFKNMLEKLVDLNKEASEVGMKINQAKTKAMRINNKNTVTDLLKVFLGNGSVNTFQSATMEDVSQRTSVTAHCYATVITPIKSPARIHAKCVFCVVRVEYT